MKILLPLRRRHRRIRLAASLLAWALLVRVPTAHAADSESDDPRTLARSIAAAGTAAFEHGDYAEARSKFDAAYQMDPAPPYLLSLSRTELKLGHCDEALSNAEMFKAAADPNAGPEAESPDSWLGVLDAKCPVVDVQSEPSAALWITGVAKTAGRPTPWRGRLVPGSYAVTLRRPGFEEKETTLKVVAGGPMKVSFALVRTGATPDPIPVIVPPRRATVPPPQVTPAKPPPVVPPAAPPPRPAIAQHFQRELHPLPSAPPSAAKPAPPAPRAQPAPHPAVVAPVIATSAPKPAPAVRPTSSKASAASTPVKLSVPPPAPKKAIPPAATTPAPHPEIKALGWSLFAIGAAALAGAVALDLTARNDTTALEKVSATRTSASASAAITSINTRNKAAIGLFGGGGAFVVTGIALVLAF